MSTPAPHEWYIEEREYARQEARRGRRHAYPSIDARRTALVVVDLVPFFFDDDGPYVRGIVPNINALADATRAAGGLVVWVTPANGAPTAWHTGFFGAAVAERYSHTSAEGALRDRIWPGLDVRDEDEHIEKTATSAFFPGSSALPDLLTDRRVETVVVSGTVTNVCVEGTARDAATLGWRVIVAADGCACHRDQDHNASLRTIYRTFGDVRSTAEIVGLLSGESPSSGTGTQSSISPSRL